MKGCSHTTWTFISQSQPIWSWKLVELLIESPRMFFFLFYEKKIIKEIGVDTVKVVITSTAAANITKVYFNK